MSKRGTRAIRAVTPSRDAKEVLPAWKPPAKYGEQKPPEPLDDTPADIAHARLTASLLPFSEDATALRELIIWSSVSLWWGRVNRQWGQQEASMMSAEFGYALLGKPSRLAEVRPDEAARRDYRKSAAQARLDWEAADCPGLLNDLEATLAFYSEAIAKRDVA